VCIYASIPRLTYVRTCVQSIVHSNRNGFSVCPFFVSNSRRVQVLETRLVSTSKAKKV